MKVVLMQNVDKLGKVNDVVTVAEGYARNYLLPRKLAVKLDSETENSIANKRASEEWHYEQKKAKAEEDKAKVDRLKITLSAASHKITSRNVTDLINSHLDMNIDKKIVDASKLRDIPGEYEVKVRFMPGVVGLVTVVVTE